jgi:hypothetical protein
MKSDFDTVLVMAQAMLQNDLGTAALTRDMIEQKVDLILAINPAWRAAVDRTALVTLIESRFSIWIGRAVTLAGDDDHIPWLSPERKEGWRYWPRYRQMLEEKWASPAVDALDDITDDILGRLEDPHRPNSWDRRGLVVGHVQSGKTSNYTGLINKAADSGYKVIIVLAGLHKNLRSQTQMRLDEGFLGYETTPLREQRDGEIKSIGVGLLDSDPLLRPDYLTNRADNGDLSRAVANTMGINPGGRPLLLVIKKNPSVLRNLLFWIERISNGRDPATNRHVLVNVPLLLIDDEADNASVDTGHQEFDETGTPDLEHDPKTINGLIRQVLLSFEQSAFLGYTATPFANIYIHDKGRTTEEGEDLFPRSFIMNLPAPSNYDGPVRIFGLDPQDDDIESGRGLPLVRQVTDHAISASLTERRGWIPPLHKNGWSPLHEGQDVVPPSLDEAIRAFLLVCAVRAARGETVAHNSMLVHVTRFTSVQAAVKRQVQAALIGIVRRLRRDSPDALKHFREVWERDFVPTTATVRTILNDPALTDIDWSIIAERLPIVSAKIEVREINGSAKDVLDYESYRTTGLNVIAIGGDKLARGLTLEGLSVSYFLRATRMYDTLMQMGRWFGFHPGFTDLCRLYTTADLEEWFQHITDASEELRTEFDHMAAIGGTPRQYGLKVLSHPVLLVTSRVKMQNATTLSLDFSGAGEETVVFHRDPVVLAANVRAAVSLITSMGPVGELNPSRARPGGTRHTWGDARLWTGITSEQVATFLDRYTTHEAAVKVNSKVMADYIRSQPAGQLDSWTVAVLSGDGATVSLGDMTVASIKRAHHDRCYDLAHQKRLGRFIIRRLLAPRDEAIDLVEAEYSAALQIAIDEWQKDPGRSRRQVPPDVPSGASFRMVRGRRTPGEGLLLIYPLDPEPGDVAFDGPIIGIGVSFPAKENSKKITYTVNNVYWDLEFGTAA